MGKRTYKKRCRNLEDDLSVRLPSYSLSSIFIRFIAVSIISILIMEFVSAIANLDEAIKIPRYVGYILIILSFNLLSEMQILLDNILEYIFPVPKMFKLRLGLQLLLNILLIYTVFNLTILVFPYDLEVTRPAFYLGIASGLVFVTMVSNGLLMVRFSSKWINAQKYINEMEQEKMRMDYSALQDQLNPHFLFNNLSVLKSLIIYDKDSAVQFTENFTDVYRYVLKSKDKMVVEFKEEQKFINSYIGLHKERLGEGLEVKFSIGREELNKNIAPLTMQLLVENAIKHNITSKENPLEIKIKARDGFLIVENKVKLKDVSYSTHTGLSNLIKRYQMLTDKEIEIENENDIFRVKVPLL